jgi:ABC-type nitrate/sulfonate/bicarbonate transport system ATPase subunit
MISVRIEAKNHSDPNGVARQILRGVSFHLKKAETVALLGRSGIGKTSLLHLIAGLDTDFDGRIDGDAGQVGFVFQSPRLLPWRTALQNLQIVAPERDTEELRDLLQTVGVADAASLFPGQLSLGMARRVAVARALAVRPSLLLLDEPFASLDVETAMRLRGTLKQVLIDSGIPSLFVTHDPAEAMDLADRIIVLGGAPATVQLDRVIAEVTVDEIAASVAE